MENIVIIEPTSQNEVVTLGQGVEHKAKIASSATFLMNAVTKIYQNPIEAVIREYICNAWDAHITAGRTDIPLDVSFDSENSIFRVRDYGDGIPDDLIEDIFLTVGGSTKREDAAVTGAWGVGSKVGWAIQDSFTVISRCNGVATTYNMLKSSDDADGFPVAKTVISLPTAESGLTVEIMLEHHNISHTQISNYIAGLALLGGIKIRFTFNGVENVLPTYDWEKMEPNAGKFNYSILKLDDFNHLNFSGLEATLFIKINNNVFPYPLRDDLLETFKDLNRGILWVYAGTGIYPDMARERITNNEYVEEQVQEFLAALKKSMPSIVDLFKIFTSRLEKLSKPKLINALNLLSQYVEEEDFSNHYDERLSNLPFYHDKDDIEGYLSTHMGTYASHKLYATTLLKQMWRKFRRKALPRELSKLQRLYDKQQSWYAPSWKSFAAKLDKKSYKFFKVRELPFKYIHPNHLNDRYTNYITYHRLNRNHAAACSLAEIHIFSTRALKKEGLPSYINSSQNGILFTAATDKKKTSIWINSKHKKQLPNIIKFWDNLGSTVVLHGFAIEDNGTVTETYDPPLRSVTPTQPKTWHWFGFRESLHEEEEPKCVILLNNKKKGGLYFHGKRPAINNSFDTSDAQLVRSIKENLDGVVVATKTITRYNSMISSGHKSLAKVLTEKYEKYSRDEVMFAYWYYSHKNGSNAYNNPMAYWTEEGESSQHSVFPYYIQSLCYRPVEVFFKALFKCFMDSSLSEALFPDFNRQILADMENDYYIFKNLHRLVPLESVESNIVTFLEDEVYASPIIRKTFTKCMAGFNTFLFMIERRDAGATKVLLKSYDQELIALYLSKVIGTF